MIAEGSLGSTLVHRDPIQRLDHMFAAEVAAYFTRQIFPREDIDHGQGP